MRTAVLALLLALAAPAPAGEPDPAPAEDPEVVPPEVPEGFRVMEVIGVAPTAAGQAVFLAGDDRTRLVPIWIGGSEALAIQLRHSRRRFERPLTHDLWDQAVRELGGELVEVRIDALRSQVFVATLTVRQGDRTFQLDSRASDAIALALGSRVPIYVADAVVDQAAISPEDLVEPGEQGGGEQAL